MHNYSSAKLELLALKWAVTEKFRDYLLGLKFTIYTDNNPLAYAQTSKLDVSPIHWLIKLALFDFNVIYRLGKTNQATDALSQCHNQIANWRVIVTVTVMIWSCCHMPPFVPSLSQSLVTPRSHLILRKKTQATNNLLEGEKNVLKFFAVPDLTVQTSAVSVFDQVPLTTLAEAQCKDYVLGLVIPFVHKGIKPKGSVIVKIKCKSAHKYLLQFDRLVLKQGVLHQIYISNDVESH